MSTFDYESVCIFPPDATIQFESLSSTVEEQDVDFTFDLLVTRDIDSEQNYSIALVGTSETAEDDDYFVSDNIFNFPPDVSSISVSVVIRGDTRIELAESFSVRLRQSGGPNFLVDLLTRSTTMEITDNDGGQCKGTYILIPLASNPIGNTTIHEFIEGYHLSTLPLALIPLSLFPLKTYF